MAISRPVGPQRADHCQYHGHQVGLNMLSMVIPKVLTRSMLIFSIPKRRQPLIQKRHKIGSIQSNLDLQHTQKPKCCITCLEDLSTTATGAMAQAIGCPRTREGNVELKKASGTGQGVHLKRTQWLVDVSWWLSHPPPKKSCIIVIACNSNPPKKKKVNDHFVYQLSYGHAIWPTASVLYKTFRYSKPSKNVLANVGFTLAAISLPFWDGLSNIPCQCSGKSNMYPKHVHDTLGDK